MSQRFDVPLDGLAAAVQAYWDEVDAYEAARVDGDEVFRFLDGPPNPSGRTHLGTVWNKVLKDAALRHARMSGYAVNDVPGYDTHLFTTEQRVAEREDVASSAALDGDALAAFEAACERYEVEHLERMTADFRQFGVWMDWDEHYRTDSPSYADTVWSTFRRLWERDRARRASQVVYWCGECEEPRFKRSEVEPDHLPHVDAEPARPRSLYVAYPLVDEDAAVVTRVPAAWHVLANGFLAVDPDREYVRVPRASGQDCYVAADAVEDAFPDVDPTVLADAERVAGEQFRGAAYERPLAAAWTDAAPRGTVYCDDRESVTGVHHGTPGVDERDRRFAVAEGIAVRDPLADDGTLAGDEGPLAGTTLGYHGTAANDRIVEQLRSTDRFLRFGDRTTWRRHCWRCETPVVPRVSEQWYVVLEDLRERLERAIRSVEWLPERVEETMLDPSNWHPEWSRDPRFEATDDDHLDWLVEQSAHWGLPIPVWAAEDDPTDVLVVGSRAELAERADQSLDPAELAPRRSALDDVTITEDGTTYRRAAGVFADRFTAALAAVHAFGQPEDDPEDWGADLIVEARDQPGLWFFMQLAVGVPAFDTMPFHRCYMHGFLTDEDGEKMSKSVGNVVTPDEATEAHSVDALRLLLVTNTEPARDLSLDDDAVESLEASLSRFLATASTVAELDEADAREAQSTAERVVTDWAVDRLETAARDSAAAVERLAFDEAAREALDAVDQVVSRGVGPLLDRVREEQGGLSLDTQAAARRLLLDAARLLAPYAPHVAEAVYQRLDGPATTVHATQWPGGHDPADAWQPGGDSPARRPVGGAR